MTERRKPRLAAAVALSVAAAGCSMIPRYERPAAPVAADWPAAVAPTAKAADAGAMPSAARDGQAGQRGLTPAADIAWQDFFGDPRLKRLIELTLSNNRDLRLAVLNIEQARAAFQIRRADLFPTVAGAAGAQRVHTPAELSPSGRETTINEFSASVGVSSYELDLFGRVRSLNQQALAQYFATEENRKAVQISLVSSVANAYLAVVADDELLKLTRDTLNTRVETFKLSKLRFDSGVASELDLRQAETLVESARASLVQLQRQRMLDENALVLLVGQSLPADLPAPQPLIDQTMLAQIPAGLPSDLLTHRPDIRALEQQLIAANANIGAARAAFFPRIALTGSFGYESLELSNLLKSSQQFWNIGPSLSVPIFDGGRNRANLESAQVGRDIAVAQYEKAIQTAFREVSDALAGNATLGSQLDALKAQAVAEGKRFSLSELRYKGGAASYLDLLDSQRSLYAVQQQVIQTQLAQLQNRVTFYRVLGGGWQESDQPAAGAMPAPTRVTH